MTEDAVSTSIGSLVGGVSQTLWPPSELRVYVALVIRDDCELAFGRGVCSSLTRGEDWVSTFSRVLVLGRCGVATAAGLGLGFSVGIALVAPSFLPKKDMRLFCFILSDSLSLGAMAKPRRCRCVCASQKCEFSSKEIEKGGVLRGRPALIIPTRPGAYYALFWHIWRSFPPTRSTCCNQMHLMFEVEWDLNRAACL